MMFFVALMYPCYAHTQTHISQLRPRSENVHPYIMLKNFIVIHMVIFTCAAVLKPWLVITRVDVML